MSESSTGPLAGSLIVVIIILLGGWYVLTHRPNLPTTTPDEIVGTPDPVLEATLTPIGTSTDPTSLKEDYNRINTDFIKQDILKLDQELK